MARRIGRVVRFHSDQVTVVDVNDGRHIDLKLRGRFRKQGIRPIVGDLVEYTPDGYGSGLVENILHRKNELKKPSVANVDQVVVVTALKNPRVSLATLDRITVLAEKAGVEIVLVFNKIDLLEREEMTELEELERVYSKIYPVYKTSVKKGWGIEKLREVFSGKVSAMAGLSGVGKSSLLNAINPGLQLRTGEVSKKGRGRQYHHLLTAFGTRLRWIRSRYARVFFTGTQGYRYRRAERLLPRIQKRSSLRLFRLHTRCRTRLFCKTTRGKW